MIEKLHMTIYTPAGYVIGKLFAKRIRANPYTKQQRGTKWFSTVAANLAAGAV